MGRQIRFYFVCEDEANLIMEALGGDTVLLADYVRSLRSGARTEIGADAIGVQVAGMVHICFKSDLGRVRYVSTGRGDEYFLESYDSFVIEYLRCGLDAETNRLVPGRLWYQHRYWTKDETGKDVVREKSEELERLYNRLIRRIKKYCKRLPDGYYIGPHAMELHQNGAELSG
jgi:hypothetical protein